MKKILFCLTVLLFFLLGVSCVTKPNGAVTQDTTAANADFVITSEQYDTTIEEVREFIFVINDIIRRRDYNSWVAALSPSYFQEISSSEYLQALSEQPAMVTRRIVLRTPEDFFQHVVVPSRANSRVDDIGFIGSNRVRVFSISTNRAGEEHRRILYDLEKIDNTWKIIN